MPNSLNERFVNLENSEFGDVRGVTKATDRETGDTVMIKWIQIRSQAQLEEAEVEARNLSAISKSVLLF